ncbi:MAG: hypothetical protein PWQ44_1609 [Methanolobus sp.]|jgi:hypothetical protein|nr:hypothetical protein [Methanolobus sp.]
MVSGKNIPSSFSSEIILYLYVNIQGSAFTVVLITEYFHPAYLKIKYISNIYSGKASMV